MGQRRKDKPMIKARRVVAVRSKRKKNHGQKNTPKGPKFNMAAREMLREQARQRKAHVSKHLFSAPKINIFNFGASKMQGFSFWTRAKLKR